MVTCVESWVSDALRSRNQSGFANAREHGE